ncbi:DUF7344 domain-containing protein [Natrinema versiforme]|uniref:DUF7344 domain-containing protein n=1 Tax=Natrinema versiforme JCM 10478 TaxID=1227496 RepID=L9XT42_9EURY|nr:hypothetical protein [Natrinema versiforme]ELY63813.1 hypothetical protein C489_18224 [Natrinema versiforme JCM 10478]
MDKGVANPDLDTIYEHLSESRRRYVLYYFLESGHANVEEIALQISAWEQDVSIGSVSVDEKEAVTLSLIHKHLPRLADHEIITYDQRSGDIVIGDNFDSVRPTVTRARESEQIDPVVRHPTESVLHSDPLTEPTDNE